jgi:beta-galactosidase GanA
MTVGVCYFPEHWPRERWETDVAQMAEAGLEYVRMGEFSWSRLEPRRGEFDFEWLDRAVELVGDHGMQVVLCTPTATPPKWLVDERPDILQEEPDGTTREFGSRRHYCFNAESYREETERVVSRMVDHYAGNPHVAGWQTDNEYGCHRTVRCYCDDCAAGFRDWLRERYGSVDVLNEEWGTTFWSQRHADFGEVDPPRHTPAEHHPSRLLDYYRFASDSVVDYNRLQADIIRSADDGWFVTHNFMGDFPTLDAFDVSEDLDFAAWDSYPTGFVQDRRPGEPATWELRAGDPDQVGRNHDLYRGASGGPFWVMEQQPGDVNWPPYAPQPADGAMRLWAHQAVAHGADAVLYFRWRRCREGQEQYHAGLRKQDGSPDRAYDEATTAASELADLTADLGPVDAPVALLHEYDSEWAIDIQPHAPDFDYWEYAASRSTWCRRTRTWRATTRWSPRRSTSRTRASRTGSPRSSGTAASCWSGLAPASRTAPTSCRTSPRRDRSPTSSARRWPATRVSRRPSRPASRIGTNPTSIARGPSGSRPTTPRSRRPTTPVRPRERPPPSGRPGGRATSTTAECGRLTTSQTRWSRLSSTRLASNAPGDSRTVSACPSGTAQSG